MPNDGEPPQRETLRTRLARLIAGGPEPEATSTVATPAASPSAIRLRLKEFETSSVRDVMTSRVDISAVDVTSTIGEVLGVFATEAHSRMPVFRDSIDEPLGFIHIKDVVTEGVRRGWSQDLLASPIEKLMRDIMFVPESILLRDLLIQMQASRIHIAMVVDEYGGTGGMVCLEDLVESIVGDIEDEHDDARPKVSRRGRSIWDVDGLASIEHVERETGLPLHVDEFESDVETIGGLVAALGGRVLQTGESIEHPRGPIIEVLSADPRRVMRLRIRSARPAPTALAEDKTAAIDR